MKQAATSDLVSDFSKVTLDKILTIEKDVMALKLSILKKLGPMGEKPLKLKGIIPDVEITDEDIAFGKGGHFPYFASASDQPIFSAGLLWVMLPGNETSS